MQSLDKKSSTEDEDYMFTVSDIFVNSKITISVGNIPLELIIDSGSSCNIIDKTTWNFLKTKNHLNVYHMK